MIYPQDFPPKKNINQITIATSINDFNMRGLMKPLTSDKTQTIQIRSIWTRYCLNSSVHGLRYLVEPTVKANERFVWFVLISLAFCGTLYVSLLLQVRYSTNKLATVVESTMYPVASIPYPAVTICNNNRVNWDRVPSALDYFLKNGTSETIGKLTEIIIGLNSFEFSSFEHFENVVHKDVSDLDNINVTELFSRVIHSCEEMFIEPCWWRSKYVQCCGENGLFVWQRSEYGICYAFNSVLNENGSSRYLLEKDYPWRTTKFSDWSGIRAYIRVNDSTRIPNTKTKSGVLVMLHHPLTWPIAASFVPAGSSTYIRMTPKFSYASKGVLSLQPKERNCLVTNEIHTNRYSTLPGTEYFFTNCICNCRRQYLISTCNCTVDFIYPSGNDRQCKISDYKCLNQFNDLYNHEKPLPGNDFFSDEEEGMVCDCLPECEAVDYAFDVAPAISTGTDNGTDNQILLDVHFQRSTLFKYRTDVVFDWLDLMVGFGGIAGLFLGISLMSIAEGIFYLGVGILNILRGILHVILRVICKVK
ncbi:pickpocket protein 19-like [Bradysia coprophila]|uniref:pickpocket protein 19-like n=1 Tax=Bradysia coprophila TaxID=38358 RepID=UPI00187D98D5|nr:pickpocket protein 19-like [Bradysia coprophila]